MQCLIFRGCNLDPTSTKKISATHNRPLQPFPFHSFSPYRAFVKIDQQALHAPMRQCMLDRVPSCIINSIPPPIETGGFIGLGSSVATDSLAQLPFINGTADATTVQH